MRVLVISMWPTPASPEFGIFVQRQTAALESLGVEVAVAGLTDTRSGRVRTPFKYASLLTRATAQARRFRPDLIHSHYLVPTGFVARTAARISGVPYVVTAHGTDVRNAEGGGKVAEQSRAVATDARAVIAVSAQLGTRLQAVAPACEPHVIDMGVDTSIFHPDPPAARDAVIADATRLVSVGSLLPNKNHASLIRAVAQVPHARLVIIGEGPTRPALELLINELGVRDRITLTGRLPQQEIAGWYQRMDAAALVSHDEGFGLSALEAAACGCPVIVSATAPVATVIDEHGAGWVVAPDSITSIAEAVMQVQTTPRLTDDAVDLVTAGRTTVDRATEVYALYERVTAASRG